MSIPQHCSLMPSLLHVLAVLQCQIFLSHLDRQASSFSFYAGTVQAETKRMIHMADWLDMLGHEHFFDPKALTTEYRGRTVDIWKFVMYFSSFLYHTMWWAGREDIFVWALHRQLDCGWRCYIIHSVHCFVSTNPYSNYALSFNLTYKMKKYG